MTQENGELVREGFARWNEGDYDFFVDSTAPDIELLSRWEPHRVPAKRLAKLLRFVAQIGVGLLDWPCGHQPRPQRAKTAEARATRRGNRLRGARDSCGASFVQEAYDAPMARALASETIEAVGLRE